MHILNSLVDKCEVSLVSHRIPEILDCRLFYSYMQENGIAEMFNKIFSLLIHSKILRSGLVRYLAIFLQHPIMLLYHSAIYQGQLKLHLIVRINLMTQQKYLHSLR